MRPGPGTWTVPLREPPASARARLVVAPHAGSGPHALAPIVARLPPDIDVVGVVLPGREHRLDEPVHTLASDPVAVVRAVHAELAALPPLRTVAFGHSLGAVLAGALAARFPGAVSGAVLSAYPRPATPAQRAGRWTDDELLALLRRGGATPDTVLASRAWRDLVLRRLRADLTLAARLSHLGRTHRPAVAATLLSGADDDIAPPVDDPAGWPGPRTRTRSFPGGHFYLLEPAVLTPVADELARACRVAPRRAGARAPRPARARRPRERA